MATKPSAFTVSATLTNYGFAVFQDNLKLLALANALAPITPTGLVTGSYNKFDTKMAFKTYGARRAVGGKATEIQFLSEAGTFSAKPNGLRISIDQHEVDMAGGEGSPGYTTLQNAKTRTLVINSMQAHAAEVISKVKAGVAATANVGHWTDGNVDPIKELNDQVVAFWKATGMLPNRLVMDLPSWVTLANHPLIIKRMPGAELAVLTVPKLQALMGPLAPEVVVSDAAELTGGGVGDAVSTKTSMLGGTALLLYSATAPTPYDPSAAKTFAPRIEMFSSVRSYLEAPNLTWYETDWTTDTVIVSSLMIRRFEIT
jgi:hypothetical protein